MKLYSKHHIVMAVVITAAVVGAISFQIAFNLKNHNSQAPEKNSDQETEGQITELVSHKTEEPFTESNASAEVDSIPKISVSASDTKYTVDEQQNINVYEKCNEAVVNITTQVMGVNWFLEPVVESGGSGSGSIIDSRGYVVTNVHVVSGASKIYISLSDGSQFEGKVVGLDEESDIAVLKFNSPQGTVLKTIAFGDSTALKVGQKVIAIGNPFGLERTMTTGIVSGLGRPIQNSNNTIIRDMIQTDTAINPGNSGGPLLDTSGKMIGINTMIYSSSGNSAGVGFAVPAATAQRVVNDLLRYGSVQRGIIQAELVQMNTAIANYANLDINRGVLVSQVISGGNADKAAIKGGTQAVRYGSRNPRTIYLGGDIIVAINGEKVSTLADYLSLLESKRPGESVTLTLHRNRKNINVTVLLVADTN